jgi:hypothetical protein
MFTTLEIILMVALAYLLIGNIITLIISSTGIMDTSDIAITTFLWLGIPFIFLYNKLKNIIK